MIRFSASRVGRGAPGAIVWRSRGEFAFAASTYGRQDAAADLVVRSPRSPVGWLELAGGPVPSRLMLSDSEQAGVAGGRAASLGQPGGRSLPAEWYPEACGVSFGRRVRPRAQWSGVGPCDIGAVFYSGGAMTSVAGKRAKGQAPAALSFGHRALSYHALGQALGGRSGRTLRPAPPAAARRAGYMRPRSGPVSSPPPYASNAARRPCAAAVPPCSKTRRLVLATTYPMIMDALAVGE